MKPFVCITAQLILRLTYIYLYQRSFKAPLIHLALFGRTVVSAKFKLQTYSPHVGAPEVDLLFGETYDLAHRQEFCLGRVRPVDVGVKPVHQDVELFLTKVGWSHVILGYTAYWKLIRSVQHLKFWRYIFMKNQTKHFHSWSTLADQDKISNWSNKIWYIV